MNSKRLEIIKLCRTKVAAWNTHKYRRVLFDDGTLLYIGDHPVSIRVGDPVSATKITQIIKISEEEMNEIERNS